MLVYIYIDGKPYCADIDKYNKEYVTFGSGPDCDIKLNKSYVSYHHGFFARKNGEWFIKDYNSENGIYLHSNRIDVLNMKDCSVKIFGKDNPKDMIRIISETQMEIMRQYQKQAGPTGGYGANNVHQGSYGNQPPQQGGYAKQDIHVNQPPQQGNHVKQDVHASQPPQQGNYVKQDVHASQPMHQEDYAKQTGYIQSDAANGTTPSKGNKLLGNVIKMIIIIASLVIIVGCFLPAFKFSSEKVMDEKDSAKSFIDNIFGEGTVDSVTEGFDELILDKKLSFMKTKETRHIAIAIIVFAIISAALAAKNEILIISIIDAIAALVNPIIIVTFMVIMNNMKNDTDAELKYRLAAKAMNYQYGLWMIFISSIVVLILAIVSFVLAIIHNKRA